MKLKQLFTDDSAVSPVIGVILMVAITVILAAVIGTFVLNLGGSISQTTPQASFGFDYEADGSGFRVTHDTGKPIDLNSSSVRVVGDDITAVDWDSTEETDYTISAGDSLDVTQSYTNGGSYRVVWESANSENSATLTESTAPSN